VEQILYEDMDIGDDSLPHGNRKTLTTSINKNDLYTEHVKRDTPTNAKPISHLDIGLSIREVAKRIGISQSIVSRLKCCPCPRSQHNQLGL
jgi:DNA-directed RNA polymerase specialized sigma subunit